MKTDYIIVGLRFYDLNIKMLTFNDSIITNIFKFSLHTGNSGR
jgi:hypothetical protein